MQSAESSFRPESKVMNSITSQQPVVSEAIPPAVFPSDSGFHRAGVESLPAPGQLGPRRVGYALPCIKCKTYYAADLAACPVCKTEERVLPTPVVASSNLRPQEAVAPAPDDAALEAERERFLREFKAQVYASDDETGVHSGL